MHGTLTGFIYRLQSSFLRSHPSQSGTPVPSAQAAVWLCEGALPWFEEKHGADRDVVCPVQSVDGQVQIAGHGAGACARGVMPTKSGNCFPQEALGQRLGALPGQALSHGRA